MIARGLFAAAALVLALMPGPARGQSGSPFTWVTRYDVDGRVTGTIAPDPDGTGPLHHMAVRNSYDANGRLIKVEKGELSAWQSESAVPAAWSGFTIFQTLDMTYDLDGRKLSEALSGGGAAWTRTDWRYDEADRMVCQTVRLDRSSNFANAPSDACALGPPTAAGYDRVTVNRYDSQGRLQKVEKAYGTSLRQDYVTYEYSANGRQSAVIDANGNRAEMTYDALDRQSRWVFPSTTTAGVANAPGPGNLGDYEEYGYDENGNRISLKKRDDTILTYSYDALDRMVQKNVPASTTGAAGYSVFYGYDLRGLQAYARFGSASGPGVSNAYDNLGRLLSSTTTVDGAARTMSSQYDSDGNRTVLSGTDGGYYAPFSYDGLDRMNAYVTVTSILYDPSGRRQGVDLGPGAWATYHYDGAGRLDVLDHHIAGAPQTLTFGYNAASQMVTRTGSNDGYHWTAAYNLSRSYSVNGLNQYTQTAGTLGTSYAYDRNGNLIWDGSSNFVYDGENRLVAASGAKNATLSYDPFGRLWQVSGAATGTTRFLYEGDKLVMELGGSGAVTRAYVHGPGADEPMVTYGPEGRRFLHTDHQGSIIAANDDTGTATLVNSYDPWGVPATTNQGRFGYTGQTWLPELGMWYYKARLYWPMIGRFMQTDPIGYKDQINLYAYVGNDPENQTDSMGLCTLAKNAKDDTPPREICHPASSLNSSAEGRTAIRDAEGRRNRVYQDSGGLPTVGIGHLVTPGDHLRAGSEITDERVDTLFSSDLDTAEAGVERLVGDLPVSQQEFDALTDLVFNVGDGRLSATNSPGLNDAIDRQDYGRIGDQIRYTRDASGHTPQGLVDRNDRRQNIFRHGNYDAIRH